MYCFYFRRSHSKVIFLWDLKKKKMTYLSILKPEGKSEGERQKRTYPNDESDSCTSRGCHDFCTIGDEIKKGRYNGFSAMIKFVSQNC